MRAIKIIEAFTGFPGGSDDSARAFTAGETVSDLPADFADLIITKGHAVEVADAPATGKSPPKITKGNDA